MHGWPHPHKRTWLILGGAWLSTHVDPPPFVFAGTRWDALGRVSNWIEKSSASFRRGISPGPRRAALDAAAGVRLFRMSVRGLLALALATGKSGRRSTVLKERHEGTQARRHEGIERGGEAALGGRSSDTLTGHRGGAEAAG